MIDKATVQTMHAQWNIVDIMEAPNVGIWALLLWLAVYLRVPGPHWPLLKAVRVIGSKSAWSRVRLVTLAR